MHACRAWYVVVGDEKASTHMLAHVFTGNCMHTVFRHIGVT